jgi:glucosamine-6-phosphate deaminase
MRVIIRENAEQMSLYAAEYVKNRILDFNPTEEKPFVLGLPTGSTPILVYKKLVEFHKVSLE